MSSHRYYKRQSHNMDNDELRSYNDQRRQIYPETHRRMHPSRQAEADYNEYKKHTEDANEAVEAYNGEYENVAGDDNIETLEGHQHQELLLPSAEAALNTSTNASSRDTFLRNHPYGYANHISRQRHERLLDEAYDEAEFYRDCYESHHKGAGDHPENLQSGRTSRSGFAMDPNQHNYDYDEVGEVVEDEEEDYDRRYAEVVDSSDDDEGGEGEGYNQMYGGADDNAVNNYFEGEVDYEDGEQEGGEGDYYGGGGYDDDDGDDC